MRLQGFAVAILSAQLLLSGCASVHLYNAARDKQGADAKTAWSEVDLPATIAAERANLQKLLAAELQTQDRLAAAIRDNRLRYLVSDQPMSETLVGAVKEKQKKLAGAERPDFAAATGARGDIKTVTRAVEDAREAVAIEIGKAPTCASLKGELPKDIAAAIQAKSETDRVVVEKYVDRLKAQCGGLAAAQAKLDEALASFGGQIAAARAQWQGDAKLIAAAESSSEALKLEYREALKAYEAALAAGSGGASVQAKLDAALAKVDEAVGKLEKLQSGLGKQFIAQERLDSLEQVLKALAGSEGAEQIADEKLRKAVASVAALPHLADEGRAMIEKSRRARTTPFLIEKEHQRLLLDSATREVEARKRTARLAQQIFEALVEEAMLLGEVQTDLDGLAALHAQSFGKALSSSADVRKRSLYSVAGRYLDAVGRLEARVYKLEYERIASIHEAALTRSEVALLMWNNVIGASVEQVAGYHASGIRSEVIVQALQAAGVLWIGHGVNR